MLIPEISLLASATGMLLALISCLLVLLSRRKMFERIDELKFELEVHMSANHEMAKQLRVLQNRVLQKTASMKQKGQREDHLSSTAEYKSHDEDSRYEAYSESRGSRYASPPSEAETQEYKPKPGLSLAEKLGLSQSEADIITHLRPRKKRLLDTA